MSMMISLSFLSIPTILAIVVSAAPIAHVRQNGSSSSSYKSTACPTGTSHSTTSSTLTSPTSNATASTTTLPAPNSFSNPTAVTTSPSPTPISRSILFAIIITAVIALLVIGVLLFRHRKRLRQAREALTKGTAHDEKKTHRHTTSETRSSISSANSDASDGSVDPGSPMVRNLQTPDPFGRPSRSGSPASSTTHLHGASTKK